MVLRFFAGGDGVCQCTVNGHDYFWGTKFNVGCGVAEDNLSGSDFAAICHSVRRENESIYGRLGEPSALLPLEF
jgi:hypothetical protein